MDPFSLISLGVAGVGAIGGLISKFSSGNKLNSLYQQDPTYQQSPYAQNQLALAQSLLNARMPGATAMERNIYQNQASQIGNVNRNATDASQALAMGAASQGQTNQAFSNLATQEQQDYYNRLQNLNTAQQGMTAERDKQYQDQVRRFNDLAALSGAKMQNNATAWNSVANLGFGAYNVASMLNPNSRTGGGGSSGMQPYATSYMGMQPQQASIGYSNYMPNYMPNTILPGMAGSMSPITGY